MQHAC